MYENILPAMKYNLKNTHDILDSFDLEWKVLELLYTFYFYDKVFISF